MTETDHEYQNISKEGEIRVDLRIKKIFLEKARLLWGLQGSSSIILRDERAKVVGNGNSINGDYMTKKASD